MLTHILRKCANPVRGSRTGNEIPKPSGAIRHVIQHHRNQGLFVLLELKSLVVVTPYRVSGEVQMHRILFLLLQMAPVVRSGSEALRRHVLKYGLHVVR
ncbi:hypothetical protein CQB49_19370 [Salmonella enterica]|nr:hypothetical protein [Salmonella enterica subsp. enterica serovar Oranienburg]EAM2147408.1 hypothetical protein [Salmonella enterica]EAS6851510.1 hypothetical protein [Salmonella enterica subsp. enterica serovar Minnesota]PAP50242.1 hypothetical protein CJS40_09080 [Salmonella enterica subsp. enterica serovar Aberdeen]EAM5907678.1 hypothetical protein [Salmonella enterica]